MSPWIRQYFHRGPRTDVDFRSIQRVTATIASWSARAIGVAFALLALGHAGYGDIQFIARLSVRPELLRDTALQTNLVYSLLRALTVIVASVIATVVLARAARARGSTVFGLFLASGALAYADEGSFALLRRVGANFGLPFATDDGKVLALFYSVLVALALGTFLRWSQLFPARSHRHSLGIGRRLVFRRIAASGVAAGTVGVTGAALFVTADVRLAYASRIMLQIFLAMAVTLAVTMNLRASYCAGDHEARRRIYWVVAAAVAGSSLLLASLGPEIGIHVLRTEHVVVDWLHTLLMPLGLGVFVVLLAFGVLFHDALQVDLVLRGTIVYGSLIVLITGLFVGLENLLSSILAGWFGLPSAIGGWSAALVIALAFDPIRKRAEFASRRLTARLYVDVPGNFDSSKY
jgi:hypothetical protein